jgi:hypothetical protein
MDTTGFIEKYADVLFKPTGGDALWAFMTIDDSTIYVRSDDIAITEGLAIREMWPLVSKIELP